MRKTVCLSAGTLLLCSLLFAQNPNADSMRRMRDLHDLTKSVEADNARSQEKHVSLLTGPDDDPTLDADVIRYEAPPAARKAAERAEHLSKKQQHDKAIAEFQKAVQIDPHYYEAANNLALEYFSAGQPDAAIDTLKHLTEAQPKYVLGFDNLAIILCNLGRYKEAEVYATHAYTTHPFSYKAAFVYGTALANQGKRTPKAKQALQYASEKHPEANQLLATWPSS